MRSCVVLVLVAACWSKPPPVVESPRVDEPPRPRGASVATVDPDPDRDRVVGACDLCPTAPETFNAILDADGCPDSSGTSHAVVNHPTHRHGAPIASVGFATGKAEPQAPWPALEIDDDVEVVAAIGRARIGEPAVLATQRARALAAQLRTSARVEVLATTAQKVFVDEPGDPAGQAYVQVLRARGIDVYRWDNDHLVRATPRAELRYSDLLPPECID